MLSILLIGVGLSMDAFAVSVTSGLTVKGFGPKHAALLGLYFGGFQFLMPLIGYLLGSTVSSFVSAYAPYISFFLLAFVGVKMLVEAIRGGDKAVCHTQLKHSQLLVMAIATSLDALAVGISFAFMDVPLLASCVMIGCTTFVLCFIGGMVGGKIPGVSCKTAGIAGGVVLCGEGGGMLEGEAQRLDVVVGVYETRALVQAQAGDDAGMRFGIVDHHVARGEEAVDDRDHALIAEVQQEGVGFADELCQFALQLFVVFGLTAHHAGAHRGCHAEFGGTFGVGFAHFGVIGQAQVVVQAPVQHLLSPEGHVGTDFSFEFGECEIPVGITHVHTDRASGILFEAFKNIYHTSLLFDFKIMRFSSPQK